MKKILTFFKKKDIIISILKYFIFIKFFKIMLDLAKINPKTISQQEYFALCKTYIKFDDEHSMQGVEPKFLTSEQYLELVHQGMDYNPRNLLYIEPFYFKDSSGTKYLKFCKKVLNEEISQKTSIFLDTIYANKAYLPIQFTDKDLNFLELNQMIVNA